MGTNAMRIPVDQRTLYAAAVLAAVVIFVVPRAAQTRALLLISAAAALAWLYVSSNPFFLTSFSQQGQSGQSKKKTQNDKSMMMLSKKQMIRKEHDHNHEPAEYAKDDDMPPFAPIDRELYTLRVPEIRGRGWIDSSNDRAARSELRNLALRSRNLINVVRKAARLGARNGNTASGVKAMSALEDFFSRYHRAILSGDPEYAARTLEVLRDTRVVALNALNDVSLTVPQLLGGRALHAIDLTRDETLRCMSTLVARHAASGSPDMAAAAGQWSSPSPHDPGGIVGRADSLF